MDADERLSAMLPMMPFRPQGPIPDGAVELNDRRNLLYLYSSPFNTTPSDGEPTCHITTGIRAGGVS